MKPVTKMIWLIILIIVASAVFFVVLDDEDTKGQEYKSHNSIIQLH